MEIWRNFLKKVSTGDIGAFIFVLALFCLTFLIFSIQVTVKITDHGPSVTSREMLASRPKGGFNIVQQSISAGNTGRPGTANNLFTPPQAESEWKAAVEQMKQEKTIIPDNIGLSPTGKKMMEAELNDDLRLTTDLLDRGKFKEAIPILLKLLNDEPDNCYLKAIASSNLCAAYDGLGMQAELEKEFKRLVQALETFPPKSGFSAHMAKGLQFLAQQKEMLSKVALPEESRAYISHILSQSGLSATMTPEQYGKESLAYFGRQFPGLSSFK